MQKAPFEPVCTAETVRAKDNAIRHKIAGAVSEAVLRDVDLRRPPARSDAAKPWACIFVVRDAEGLYSAVMVESTELTCQHSD